MGVGEMIELMILPTIEENRQCREDVRKTNHGVHIWNHDKR